MRAFHIVKNPSRHFPIPCATASTSFRAASKSSNTTMRSTSTCRPQTPSPVRHPSLPPSAFFSSKSTLATALSIMLDLPPPPQPQP